MPLPHPTFDAWITAEQDARFGDNEVRTMVVSSPGAMLKFTSDLACKRERARALFPGAMQDIAELLDYRRSLEPSGDGDLRTMGSGCSAK